MARPKKKEYEVTKLPVSAEVTILPTVHSYVADTVQRLGIDRALHVLRQAAEIWDNVGEPRLSAAYRQAIAKYMDPRGIRRMYAIRQMIVVADDSGEGIEEIIESWPMIDPEKDRPARASSMEEAALFIQTHLRGDVTIEALGEGFFRVEGAKPDAAGVMSMWMVEPEEEVA